MNFVEKWGVGSGVVAFPLLWGLAVAQQEFNLFGEMPPLSAWVTALALIGLLVAAVWHAVEALRG